MTDEKRDRGAQEVTPGQREMDENAAKRQDLEKPVEGRDMPPAEEIRKKKRSPNSPWMGGG